MSFPSAIKTLPTKFFNTSNLSTVASVGIHALILGVALPGLPIFSQKENSTDRLNDVGLIELSPAEQSRLPNLSQPSLEPPTYPGVPPIDPSLFNTPSSLPSNTQGGFDPSLLPPPPPNALSFNNDLSVVSPPPSMPPLPSPPPASYYPNPNTWSNPPAPPSNLPPPQIPLPPQQTQIPDAEWRRPEFDPVRGGIDPRDLINQRNNAIAQKNQPPGYYNGMPQPRTAANSDSGQRIIQSDPRAALQEMRIRRLVAENIQGAESLIADRTNTTNEEAMRNDVRWRAKTGDAKPQEVSISGTYPKTACMRRLEGTSVYGVVVDAQGKVANSPSRPYLIKSAGYPVLNQQALRDIRLNSFTNQTGQPKSFLVRVNYAYNEKICPSVAVASPQPRENGVPRQVDPSKPAPTVVNPAPTKPDKAPAASEVIEPTQRQSEGKPPAPTIPRQNNEATVPNQLKPRLENLPPITPRQDNEATAPNQPKPRLENLPPITPKKAPEASEATEPTRQPRVEISVPPASRKAPEAERTNESTSSQKVPQASQTRAADNSRRNPEHSNAAPTNTRKVAPIRPLGTVAPRKTSEESSNSSESSSETSKP
jgi:outer membrane biosynthesis protein TonB